MKIKSYKMEVFTDNSWSTNSCRYATEQEAVNAGKELLSRWFVPSASRAMPSEDEVNYRFDTEKWRSEPIK